MERIAIVNRGDAASRCVRAIRELRAASGTRLTAIALYTDPDRDAPFVREADVALSLGPAWRPARGGPPRLANLDHGRVLAALRATGADAVWPGWGLLAEDADFVAALEERGLLFIGPSSRTMRQLGDKIAAKRLAEDCAVPVAAWSDGAVEAVSARPAAQRIGLPLLVKAAAGGGGRGIRVVEQWADLPSAIARASAEAAAAFGDGRVFLEAVLRRARHIEVQIAADAHGGCLALGLRDCSVQRRHQKVIEEAPPCGLTATVDAALRAGAVRIARAADYRGIGTVEFLLAEDGQSFVFMEVNPRLQVEHGLTELLTGLDLVQLQLRLARGEALPECAPVERGHAIEARLCAEDPSADFAPAPGTVVLFDLPGGPGVRVDTGVTRGSSMPVAFDQLIAKVLVHAPTRGDALARLTCALDAFRLVLDGGATNKGLLLDLLADDAVRRGGVDVDWLDRRPPTVPRAGGAAAALIAAAVHLYADARAAARRLFFAEAAGGAPRSLPPVNGLTVELVHGGERYRIQVLAIGDWRYRVACDGRECVVRLLAETPYAAQLEIGDARHAITWAPASAALRIEVDGRPYRVARDDGGAVRAAAPAVVIAVEVAVGERVHAGQRVALLETMKVEVPVLAPTAGVVRAVAARPNARVAAGAVLLRIEADGAPRAAAAPALRQLLPSWDDPLSALYGADGGLDLASFTARDLLIRETALQGLDGALRRLLLGFDRRDDLDAPIYAVLDAPLPDDATPERLTEFAALRAAVRLFADTEAPFSRQPTAAPDGAIGLSNEAWLRIYLRQREARGGGLPAPFVALLRAALTPYGCGELALGEELDRALLRLFTAQARRDERHRVTTALLRWLARLAAAGIELDD
ncbi:MAG: biotin carboxylase N-terminal domain-containing protein, partial [bacterium]